MERKRYNVKGKTYYSPMQGGWGSLLENGEYKQTKDYWFPILCDHIAEKKFPYELCSDCQLLDGHRHGTPH